MSLRDNGPFLILCLHAPGMVHGRSSEDAAQAPAVPFLCTPLTVAARNSPFTDECTSLSTQGST